MAKKFKTYCVTVKKNGMVNEVWMNLTRDRVVSTIDSLVDKLTDADEVTIINIFN